MPTDINWPIFSSRDILRSCLSAHLTASLLGFEEYGLTSGFLAETGLMNRVAGAKHKTAISRNEVIAFLVILPDSSIVASWYRRLAHMTSFVNLSRAYDSSVTAEGRAEGESSFCRLAGAAEKANDTTHATKNVTRLPISTYQVQAIGVQKRM